MIQVSATKLLFVGGALLPLALLSRELRFEHVAVVTTSATLLASILTITLAVLGYGAWAPLLGNTAHGLFQLLVVHVLRPFRPRLRFSLKELRGLIVFGIKASMAGGLNQLYRNVDFLIVGRVMGLEVLGMYRVARDLAMAPALAVVQVINRTALPVFSRLAANGQELAPPFYWTTRSLALLLVPIASVLALGAADLLIVVGEDKWLGAAGALGVLAWVALFRSLSQVYPQLLYARGRPGLAVVESAASLLLLLTAMFGSLQLFGDSLGVMAAVYAWLLCAPLALTADWIIAGRIVKLSLAAYLSALRDPLVGLVVVVGALLALERAVDLPAGGIGFGVKVAAALLVYTVYLRFGLGVTLRSLVASESDLPGRSISAQTGKS